MTTTSYDLERELNAMADEELRNPGSTTGSTGSSGTAGTTGTTGSLPRVDVLAPARARPSAVGAVSAEDKNLAMITHGATIAAAISSGGFLDIAVPAVAYVLFKDKSTWLKDHVKHQLNFQLTALMVAMIGAAIAAVTLGIGLIVAIPAIIFYFVVDIVASIKAMIAASRGEQYEFPYSINFLK